MFENRSFLFNGIKNIKSFLEKESFCEVYPPLLVPNPGMEVHIHPFEVYSKLKNKSTGLYLQTSPEFYMKEMLSDGFENIYSLNYAFRDEPISSTHRPQFLMLEWYRVNTHYNQIKKDIKNLFNFIRNSNDLLELETQTVTVQELFLEFLSFDILDFLDPHDLKQKIYKDFNNLYVNDELAWEDWFFLLFLNFIEPSLKNYKSIIVDEYPAPLAALSTLKPTNKKVCERFEFFVNGIEIANCFNELVDINEQKDRFSKDIIQKRISYNYELPEPTILYNALSKGIPSSCGIALGVERFLSTALEKEKIIFYL